MKFPGLVSRKYSWKVETMFDAPCEQNKNTHTHKRQEKKLIIRKSWDCIKTISEFCYAFPASCTPWLARDSSAKVGWNLIKFPIVFNSQRAGSARNTWSLALCARLVPIRLLMNHSHTVNFTRCDVVVQYYNFLNFKIKLSCVISTKCIKEWLRND